MIDFLYSLGAAVSLALAAAGVFGTAPSPAVLAGLAVFFAVNATLALAER